MPSVSSSSLVAGTSSSDLTPQETITTRVRASSPRSDEMSGGRGNSRWTPPRPPVAITSMPSGRTAASVPPTVVAPSAPCTQQAARSRAPTLRAAAPASPKRRSSASLRPTTSSPSRMPTVAGIAPAARTAASDDAPTAKPSPAREAVGDERRLEAHDRRRRARARRRPRARCAAARSRQRTRPA